MLQGVKSWPRMYFYRAQEAQESLFNGFRSFCILTKAGASGFLFSERFRFFFYDFLLFLEVVYPMRTVNGLWLGPGTLRFRDKSSRCVKWRSADLRKMALQLMTYGAVEMLPKEGLWWFMLWTISILGKCRYIIQYYELVRYILIGGFPSYMG